MKYANYIERNMKYRDDEVNFSTLSTLGSRFSLQVLLHIHNLYEIEFTMYMPYM